jgi:hypothetical protein
MLAACSCYVCTGLKALLNIAAAAGRYIRIASVTISSVF